MEMYQARVPFLRVRTSRTRFGHAGQPEQSSAMFSGREQEALLTAKAAQGRES